ncbi:MAG: hypothetical protein WC827_01690 [Candidatus Paceibacterota bacterium]|jgi:hypothetical protein
MSSIRIISIPPGQAPEWVRKEWIGVEIPLSEQKSSGIQMGVRGGAAKNVGGYQVETSKAIEALQKKSPMAAKWWKDNVPLVSIVHLVFSKEVCELVS